MEEVRIKCHIRGTRPLLMNAFVDESGNGHTKRGKVYKDDEEALKRLYRDAGGNICQPATHLEGCMVKSAADFKFEGRKSCKDVFLGGIFVEPLMIPHLDLNWVIDKQLVKVKKAGIMRCRPRFDAWELKFDVVVKEPRIEPALVQKVLESGGRFIGIGDYRPRYGLFEIVGFEPPSDAPVIEKVKKNRKSS